MCVFIWLNIYSKSLRASVHQWLHVQAEDTGSGSHSCKETHVSHRGPSRDHGAGFTLHRGTTTASSPRAIGKQVCVCVFSPPGVTKAGPWCPRGRRSQQLSRVAHLCGPSWTASSPPSFQTPDAPAPRPGPGLVSRPVPHCLSLPLPH